MPKEIIFSEKTPKSVGPNSEAIISGDFVFISGQISINPQTSNVVEGGIEVETIQVLSNLNNILNSNELTTHQAVKISVFI